MGRPRKVVLDDSASSDQLYPLGESDIEEAELDEEQEDITLPLNESIEVPYTPKTPYNTALFIKQGKKVCSKCGGQAINTINNEPRCNENLGMECPRIKEYYEPK